MFKRIQQYFIGDFLDKSNDPIEKAGIRMIFYLLLMAVTLVWLIIPSLLYHGEYVQAARSITVNAIFIGMLFFIRRFHSVTVITHILILISFANMAVNIFFNFNKLDELEVINAGINILVAFYILKKRWGIFYSFLHLALLFLFISLKEFGIIPEEPFATAPLNEYILSITILSVFTIFIIHHFVSAFELATENLKSSLRNQMALTHQYQELSEQLKTSEGNLTSLIENYRDSIFSFDNNFRLITFNTPFAKVVKKFKLESPKRGRDIRTLVPLEDGKEELYYEAFEKALGGKIVKFEDTVAMGVDSSRIYEVSVNPIWIGKSNQNGVSVFAKDITDRETARLELIKAKEMAEEMNRIKTNFLANMSHEIRTPINGILGISQIIALETKNPEIREYADIQRQSGKRLLETINSILNLSRIEAGGTDEITLTKLNLVDLLEENMRPLSGISETKNLALLLEKPGMPVYCLGDEAMLHQVFNNIIGNALKFTEEGGVTISIKPESRRKNFVSIYIQDTGVGISEQFLPKLFQSFMQEKAGHNREFEGSGLGLSIAKKYVDLLGGDILVTSRKGIGTTFEVQLPLFQGALQSEEEKKMEKD